MGYCTCCGRITFVGCLPLKHEAHIYAWTMVQKGYAWNSNGSLVDTRKKG